MTTPAQLRELSDAATQGEWYSDTDGFACNRVGAFGVDTNGGPSAIARMRATSLGSFKQQKATATFIAALVNAYRAGDLVHRDEVAGWHPIETAPKDGTWFLARCDLSSQPRVVRWADKYDRLPIGANPGSWASLPTHWMPLPPPPQPEDSRALHGDEE